MSRNQRGWVFVDEENEEEVGFAELHEYRNAEIAVEKFGREYADHFSVFFRNSNGKLHSVADEDIPEDFD